MADKSERAEAKNYYSATIVLARTNIRRLEKGLNAWKEPISVESANEGIVHETREVHVALMHANEANLPLNRGVRQIAANIEAKYLVMTKAHFDKIQENSGGGVKFVW